MLVSRLIYHSVSLLVPARETEVRELNAILDASNRNNRSRDVTGAVIFDRDVFVQVLEGERDAVWSLYKNIRIDRRHGDVTLVEWVHDVRRQFGNWWMGGAERTGLNAPLFERFVRQGRFEPARMTAAETLSLMRDLEDGGLSRELGL